MPLLTLSTVTPARASGASLRRMPASTLEPYLRPPVGKRFKISLGLRSFTPSLVGGPTVVRRCQPGLLVAINSDKRAGVSEYARQSVGRPELYNPVLTPFWRRPNWSGDRAGGRRPPLQSTGFQWRGKTRLHFRRLHLHRRKQTNLHSVRNRAIQGEVENHPMRIA